MNQTQAIAKLRKLLGSKLGYRIDKDAPDAEQREKIREAWQAAKQIADAAEAARDARYKELLQDARYQELKAAAIDTKKAAEMARSGMYRKRITVGRVTGPFFSIDADGDNWDEVVETVANKKA